MKKVSFTLAAVAALAFAACNGPAKTDGVDSAAIKDSIRRADSAAAAAQATPTNSGDSTKNDSDSAKAAAPAAPAAH